MPGEVTTGATVSAGEALTVTPADAVAVPHELVDVYVIIALPPETPVTTPPDTVATPVLLELHVPPVAPSVSVATCPKHKDNDAGDMVPALGAGLTVTVA